MCVLYHVWQESIGVREGEGDGGRGGEREKEKETFYDSGRGFIVIIIVRTIIIELSVFR